MGYTYPNTRLLIDGAWCDGAASRTIAVVDPATGETVGKGRVPKRRIF